MEEPLRWGASGRGVAALLCSVWTSVAELGNPDRLLSPRWNDQPEPFAWTKPADEILDKVTQGRATLDRITKSAMHH